MTRPLPPLEKGRGATVTPQNRYEHHKREAVDDGWNEVAEENDDAPAPLKTTVTIQLSRSILTRNSSPDIPYGQSMNPYQGCEHGCVYCYARPSHAYLDLSPGLDFESKLFAKPNAAGLLRAELAKPGYVCTPIALGGNTDCYQPIEREYKITRSILEVLNECNHPVGMVTKSALVERDIDILSEMAKKNLVRVYFSVTTLDKTLARKMEPRAAAPARRLEAMKALSDAGIPTGVMVAPIIPQLNDKDIEAILEASYAAGARSAGYVMLRLPHELKEVFKDWLQQHYPLRAEHVMSLIKQLRGGKEYDAAWGTRMRGTGEFADFIEQRFRKACARYGLNQNRQSVDVTQFRKPRLDGQLDLFA
ncbi:MAG: PA0069 family radical SAM protein [Burkholderiales bacterium]